MTSVERSRPYTPQREDPAVLAARTVGRERLLASLQRSFRSAATKANRNHTLLVGPRGSGKSHVIEVALYALRQDAALASRFAVVRLPEDAMGLVGIERVTALVCADLGVRSPPASLAAQQQAIHVALDGRVLLLVVENLDRVMRALGPGGQRDLRSWVETSGDVLLLASTPLLFAGVQDRDKPWYGAFATIAVPPLTPREGHELLLRLAGQHGDGALAEHLRTPRGRARVRALAELTGGSPRVWTILSGCVTPESLDALGPAVHELLEELVPAYQQLLWDLPPGEQVVVEALSTGRYAALTVSELAAATGIGQPQVSKIVRGLAANRWVVADKLPRGDQRRTWYQLREPLLRHHVAYRAGELGVVTLVASLLREYFEVGRARGPATARAAVRLGTEVRTDEAAAGLLATIIAALEGSAEARLRVPLELRALVEEPSVPAGRGRAAAGGEAPGTT